MTMFIKKTPIEHFDDDDDDMTVHKKFIYTLNIIDL